MKQKGDANAGGIGVVGLLGIVFVVLKLCGVIEWSWWWVTAPFWGGIALAGVIVLFCLAAAVIAGQLGKSRR